MVRPLWKANKHFEYVGEKKEIKKAHFVHNSTF